MRESNFILVEISTIATNSKFRDTKIFTYTFKVILFKGKIWVYIVTTNIHNDHLEFKCKVWVVKVLIGSYFGLKQSFKVNVALA